MSPNSSALTTKKKLPPMKRGKFTLNPELAPYIPGARAHYAEDAKAASCFGQYKKKMETLALFDLLALAYADKDLDRTAERGGFGKCSWMVHKLKQAQSRVELYRKLLIKGVA